MGRVYTNLNCHDVGLGGVFTPIAFGVFSDKPKEWIESIGLVYEYLEKAGPLSVNGHPQFMSVRLLNKADMPFLVEKITAFEEALNTVCQTN